ncbi:Nn.00g116160.m01.CDS01 [Neocucurbitaria sp. VM-36]
MAHDTNFAGDRLRLASFLHVVKDGMPQRPARFKPRIEHVVEQPRGSNLAALSHADLDTVLMDKNNRPSAPKVTTSNLLDSPNTIQELGSAKGIELSQVSPDPTPDPVVPCDISCEIPCSSTPAELQVRSIVDDIGCGACSGLNLHPPHLNPLLITQTRSKAETVRSDKSKKTYRKTHASSSTRPKSLSAHGLALLRTTTSNGLPEPNDSKTVFATPVTDIDPVDDSQAMSSSRLGGPHIHTLKDKVASKQKFDPSSHRASKPREAHFSVVQTSRVPASRNRNLPIVNNGKQQPKLRSEGVPGGFVGSELSIVFKRRSRRSGKPAPVKRKTAVIGELTLTSGLLPVPASKCIEAPMEQSKPTYPGQSHFPFMCEHFQGIARLEQLMACSHSTDKYSQTKSDRSQQWDKAIHDQLSSIMAPMRCVSESSDSEPSAETDFDNGEEDSSRDDDCFTNGSQSMPLVPAPHLRGRAKLL